MQRECRIAAGRLEVRKAAEGTDTRTLAGYAAKFGVWSDDLGGFREMLQAGAFDEALKANPDVRLLINHDGIALARTTKGTLRLTADDVGLWVEADLPDTQAARDLSTSIERGDVDQMSFAFITAEGGAAWDLDAQPAERTVSQIAELFDVSVVTFPAYPQTEVALRSLGEAKAAAAPPVEGYATENIRLRRRER